MTLEYSEKLRERFPDLRVLTTRITGVGVRRESAELQKFREEVVEEVRKKYDLDELKDVPIFRIYRDFFWEIGIDPTKTRPAAEALVRRVLQGKKLPTINTLVDAYNLASLSSGIPMAAFDYLSLEGNLTMRFAREDEKFHGIGMEEAKELTGGEIVISDSEKLIAIYPHRDSDETKITTDTEDVLLMVCGAPGVEDELKDARDKMVGYVTRFCDGATQDG